MNYIPVICPTPTKEGEREKTEMRAKDLLLDCTVGRLPTSKNNNTVFDCFCEKTTSITPKGKRTKVRYLGCLL